MPADPPPAGPPPAAPLDAARLQAAVFLLVSAAFTTIYLLQPVLPVLQAEFGVSERAASTTISAVILGIALANLPFGRLADAVAIHPIIAVSGAAVAAAGLFCAVVRDLWWLAAARLVQGLFLPGLTTCIAADLARRLPAGRLNVAMGAYVAATVLGGLGGRLLGGWIHPPLHWRAAFVTASALVAAATLAAWRLLPRERRAPAGGGAAEGFFALLGRAAVLRPLAVGFSAFFVFSSLFNYLPFYLAGPPFHASTAMITLMYAAYVIGIAAAPLSGRASNRFGNGAVMVAGALIFAAALGATHLPSLPAVAAALGGVCAGFFPVHSAAVGCLNRRLASGRGRANSLYVLLYYLGGSAGITAGGLTYPRWGWIGITATGWAMLGAIALIGARELRSERQR
jgi:YNFM family putative membrane transporter